MCRRHISNAEQWGANNEERGPLIPHSSLLIPLMLIRPYKIIGKVMLLLVSVMLVSCGEPIGGNSKAPVFLIARGASDWGMMVDVYNPTIPGNVEDEFVQVIIESIYKGPLVRSEYADVILQEYRVTYYRVDGNPNVPDPIMFHLTAVVPAGSTYNMNLHILRREAKLLSPLKELAFGGGEGAIELNAYIEFFGRDLMGNQVSTSMVMDMTVTDLQ